MHCHWELAFMVAEGEKQPIVLPKYGAFVPQWPGTMMDKVQWWCLYFGDNQH